MVINAKRYNTETATRAQITTINIAAVVSTMKKNSIQRKIGRSFISQKAGWKIRDPFKSIEEYFSDS
ncbi:MAG TPA: hypothetical protein VNW06_02085 [Cytophagaceae bacterium]|nr:hypothetical protein [Cytophagaceae bacterium]